MSTDTTDGAELAWLKARIDELEADLAPFRALGRLGRERLGVSKWPDVESLTAQLAGELKAELAGERLADKH
jgi:hypothetical protein